VPDLTFRFIDLFSGAGGMAEGFRGASGDGVTFSSVYAVEVEKAFAASYEANFGHDVFAGPIERLKRTDLPTAEILIGGPPCQGFSPLGRMSGIRSNAGLNRLWRHYMKVVGWVQPLAFVVENVPEFLKSTEFEIAKKLLEKGRVRGDFVERPPYRISQGVLLATRFGIAQKRRRGFVIGIRADLDVEPTLPTGDYEIAPPLSDFIWKLRDCPLVYDFRNGSFSESHEARELHIGRQPTEKSIDRYKCIPPGGNRFDLIKKRRDLTPRCWLDKKSGSTDVFGRLEWDKPALTIRTEFFKPEKGRYLHPEFDRPITHWEAARIQTFPDTFKFCGSKTDIARQIGNAVPPKLAEAVARHLKTLLMAREVRARYQARSTSTSSSSTRGR
jgi:DNA (cytosine-5)-methyltransferase 1